MCMCVCVRAVLVQEQPKMSAWVKFPEKRSVKIRVEGHSDIDDLVKEALKEERVDACRGSVTVKFDGKEVDSGEQLSAFQTSSKKPLFLLLPAPSEGNTVGCNVINIYRNNL